jgi:Domain of unknown function (DUF4386)
MMIDDTRSFQRLAAIAAILSAPLAFGNMALGLAAIGFAPTPGMLSDAAAALPIKGIDANLLRWSLICDMFGYYLLLGPLALALGRRLEQERPSFVRLATCCGLGYVLVGAIGAVALAATAPPLIDAHAQAAGAERAAIELLYDGFVNIVNGLWNMLEVILGGVWWLTIGATVRAKRPALGVLSTVLGIAAWIDAAGMILNIALFSAIGLAGILLLIPVWSLSFGIDLLRRPAGSSPVAAPGEIAAREIMQ